MNNYLQQLLIEGCDNDCKIIKKLIEAKIVDYNQIINYAYKSDSKDVVYKIALNIAKEKDVPKLATAICRFKNSQYIWSFATHVKGAPIDILAKAICETNDAKFIYHFAKDVKGAPIDMLADAICKTNDPICIHGFAVNIKDAPVDKLAEAICRINNAEYIYYFAVEVKDAPINKLAETICKTNSGRYIYRFAKEIKDAPTDMLAKAMAELNILNHPMPYEHPDQRNYIKDFICNVDNISSESQNILVDKLINLEATEEIRAILYLGVIKDINILNKIKYYLLNIENNEIKYTTLITTVKNKPAELVIYAEIFRNLLKVETKYNYKRRVLKPETNTFSNKSVNPLKNTD